MPRPVPEQELKAIEDAVRQHPGGVTVQQIADALTGLPRRTLQYRLKYLVGAKRLIAEGERRWTKYRLPHEQYAEGAEAAAARDESEAEITLPLSKTSVEIQNYLHQPTAARKPVGYNRDCRRVMSCSSKLGAGSPEG
jgi:DNA-binding transcriptional ArsR family regulator